VRNICLEKQEQEWETLQNQEKSGTFSLPIYPVFIMPGYHAFMFFQRGRWPLLAVAGILLAGAIRPAQADSPGAQSLNAVEIVDRMQRQNEAQRAGLQHYQAVRHYSVEYQSSYAHIAAAMEVEVNYDKGAGKRFRILSQSGPKFLCEKVLKRAVDSEREASQDKGSTALTPANYRFELAGSESLDGRPAYILHVEPITASKFLYRGKVWVDATEFAVVKIEVEPAKNPSFWISRTLIRSTNMKTGEFWLPQQNRSETKVRIGGTAVFTIDYGSYQIVPETRRLAAGF
jgi:hypothetical protein